MTNNILGRVYKIAYGDGLGTCFTIDVHGRQYVVTARHVVEGMKQSDTVLFVHADGDIPMPARLVGQGAGYIDVAVLALQHRIGGRFAIATTSEGMILGQDAYIIGFPYGIASGFWPNGRFALPVLKRGVVSRWWNDEHGIWIDTICSSGFSGGPAVIERNNGMQVVGVVAGNVEDECGITLGFTSASDIRHALEIIDKNPIGVLIE